MNQRDHTSPSQYLPDDVRAATLLAGCMGLGGGLDDTAVTDEQAQQAADLIHAALDAGIDWFDHADIYARGKAESAFGEALAAEPGLRYAVRVQTKCGIRLAGEGGLMTTGGPMGRYDNSDTHIRASLEGSLERLGLDRVDVLLIHRPDPLTHPAQSAAALQALVDDGLVHQVGVSNHSPAQIAALQRELSEELVVNQLEMSLAARDWIEEGVLVNTVAGGTNGFDAQSIPGAYSSSTRLQAWGALAQGRYSGRASTTAEEATQEVVSELAARHETTAESIVLAWLKAHPVGITPVIGTSNPRRIAACADAAGHRIQLTHEEFYRLWITARGAALP